MKNLRWITVTLVSLFTGVTFAQVNEKEIVNDWKFDYFRMMEMVNEMYEDNNSPEKAEIMKVLDQLSTLEMSFNNDKSMTFGLMGQTFGGTWMMNASQLTTQLEQGTDVYEVQELDDKHLVMTDAGGMLYYFATPGNQLITDKGAGLYWAMIQTYDGAPMGLMKIMENGDLNLSFESYSFGEFSEFCNCAIDQEADYLRGACEGEALTYSDSNFGFFTSDDDGNIYLLRYTRSVTKKEIVYILSAEKQNAEVLSTPEAKNKMKERIEKDFEALYNK